MSNAHLISIEDVAEAAQHGWKVVLVVDAATRKVEASIHPVGEFTKAVPTVAALLRLIVARGMAGSALEKRVLQAVSKFNQGAKKK